MSSVTVLFLIDDLCGMAGAERALINMLTHMPRERYRCMVGTLRREPNPDIVRRLGCPVRIFPLRRTYDWEAVRIAGELRRFIREEGVQIVHTIFETSDLWGGLVAKLSGCPILISSRRDMGFNQSAKHRMAYRVMRPLFDQVQTVSEQVRQMCIRDERMAPDKVVTLYNGVDMDLVGHANGEGELRRSLELGNASHVITTVGNIRWIKGTDLVVQVAAKVCAKYPKAVFLIPGKVLEKEYYEKILQDIRALGLTSNIKFLGSSDQVFSLLKISDLFCLLSRSEGFSNALLEAMACGLPCVVTDVGGNREAIENGSNGCLVANEDVAAASEKMIALLDNPPEARRLGETARRTIAKKFTTEVMVTNLTRMYDTLLQRVR